MSKNEKYQTIVVHCEGGVVQDVVGVPSGVRVIVLDYDDGEAEDDDNRTAVVKDGRGRETRACPAVYWHDPAVKGKPFDPRKSEYGPLLADAERKGLLND